MRTSSPSRDTKDAPSQVIRKVTAHLCLRCALIAAVCMLTFSCTRATPPQSSPNPIIPIAANSTIWDGVYTEEQRRRGEAVYDSSCVDCHESDMAGDGVVPELAGEKFLRRWNRKRVGNLFEFMRTEMPPKEINRLTPPEYADVLAYILSRNQAPVGQEELAGNFAALQTIRMARDN